MWMTFSAFTTRIRRPSWISTNWNKDLILISSEKRYCNDQTENDVI